VLFGDPGDGAGAMSGDVVSLAAEMSPYVSAAVGAYGGAVLAKVRDDAADATVGLGRRLLQRIFGSRAEGESLPESLQNLAADPQDGDAVVALRLQIRKFLAADPDLATEVQAMLAEVGVSVTASGERSIAAQVISGTASTGDDTTINK
jgi:hypothetical protein